MLKEDKHKLLSLFSKDNIALFDSILSKYPDFVSLNYLLTSSRTVAELEKRLKPFRQDLETEFDRAGLKEWFVSLISLKSLALKLKITDVDILFSSLPFFTKYSSLLSIDITDENSLDEFFCRFCYSFGREYGVKIYLVGGYVRDKITGFISKDIDVDISGRIHEFADLFVVVSHIVSGELFHAVRAAGENFHINTHGLKDAGYDINLKEDIISSLREADFTINGIAIDLTPSIPSKSFVIFIHDLIYKPKLDKRHFDKLVYPDESFLDDALNKVFRITDYHKSGKRKIDLGGRAFKFFERQFESYDKQGFTFEPASLTFLISNSGFARLALKKKLIKFHFKLDEKKAFKDTKILQLLILIESFRNTSSSKTLQDFLHTHQDKLEGFSSADILRAWRLSLKEIYLALEEHIFSLSDRKDFRAFISFLKKKGIDLNYYGLDEIKRLFESPDDPLLKFVFETKRDEGKAIGNLVKSISGTAKWLKNFEGDEDERVYSCLKTLNSQSAFLSSLIGDYNIENLHHLKVADLSKRVRGVIRLCALVADVKPENIDSVLERLKKSSTISDLDLVFIKSLYFLIRKLVAASHLIDDDRFIRNTAFDIYSLFSKSLTRRFKDILKVFDFRKHVFDGAVRILKALKALQGTKYANPVYDIDISAMTLAADKIKKIMRNDDLMEYLSRPYLPLDKQEVILSGLKGKEIGDFYKALTRHKLDSPRRLTVEEARSFLKEYAAKIKKKVAVAS